MSILKWRNEQLFQSITVTCLRQFIESIYLVFTFHRCFGFQKKLLKWNNGFTKVLRIHIEQTKKILSSWPRNHTCLRGNSSIIVFCPKNISLFFEGFLCWSCLKFINNCLKDGVCLQTSFIGNKGILKVIF